jgi:FkbM family methyltransferase
MDINPSFSIDLHYAGVSYEERHIKANFGHGARNWGASEFHEVTTSNASYEVELELRSLDRVLGTKRVSLLKIDCEGCEYEALKG